MCSAVIPEYSTGISHPPKLIIFGSQAVVLRVESGLAKGSGGGAQRHGVNSSKCGPAAAGSDGISRCSIFGNGVDREPRRVDFSSKST